MKQKLGNVTGPPEFISAAGPNHLTKKKIT